MRTRSLVAVALTLLCVAGSADAQPQAIRIAARDQLAISVWNGGVREESYSVKVAVDSDGTFEYPTLGRLKAAGLTNREVEADLKGRLEKYLVSPQVTIEVEQTTGKKVIVNGQVRMPAAYAFAGDLTLFEALTRAGSLTDEALEEAVIHRSAGGEPLRVDLYDLLNGASLKNNVTLYDGDMVVIPKSDPVFITGFVQTPGPVHVKRGTTVLQAISMAGGITDRGSRGGIKIQRMVDGKKRDVPVKDMNTDVVKPGDTIVVPARFF